MSGRRRLKRYVWALRLGLSAHVLRPEMRHDPVERKVRARVRRERAQDARCEALVEPSRALGSPYIAREGQRGYARRVEWACEYSTAEPGHRQQRTRHLLEDATHFLRLSMGIPKTQKESEARPPAQKCDAPLPICPKASAARRGGRDGLSYLERRPVQSLKRAHQALDGKEHPEERGAIGSAREVSAPQAAEETLRTQHLQRAVRGTLELPRGDVALQLDL